jgi:hypothetical protein
MNVGDPRGLRERVGSTGLNLPLKPKTSHSHA